MTNRINPQNINQPSHQQIISSNCLKPDLRQSPIRRQFTNQQPYLSPQFRESQFIKRTTTLMRFNNRTNDKFIDENEERLDTMQSQDLVSKSKKRIEESMKSKERFQILKSGAFSELKLQQVRQSGLNYNHEQIQNQERSNMKKISDDVIDVNKVPSKIRLEKNKSYLPKFDTLMPACPKSALLRSQTIESLQYNAKVQRMKTLSTHRSLTIQELKEQILKEKSNQKTKEQLNKTSIRKKLETESEDIESEDCYENGQQFKLMTEQEKEEHMKHLWKKAFVKARGGALVLRFVRDLTNKIIMFGVTRKLEELEKEEFPAPYILLPDSKLKSYWNIICVVLLIYTATYMPFKTAFIDDDQISVLSNVIDWIIDSLFFLDIFVNLISAYEDDNGNLIHRLKVISQNYIKQWFFFDLIACIPFQLLSPSQSSSNYNKLIRLVRLPRLYRMLRILRLLKMLRLAKQSKQFQRLLQKLKMNSAIISMAKGMATSILLTHLFACFWFLQAKFDDFQPDTWVARVSIIDEDYNTQYIYSMYWASQTVITVGYGDIHAVTATEKIMASFWCVVGVGFYSFVIGNYSSIISSNIQIQASISTRIRSLAELAKKAQIPSELAKKIKKFVENNYESIYNQDDESQLIKMLPPSLRDEVLANTYGETIQKFKFFKELTDHDFIWKLLPSLRGMKLEKGDVLFWENDHAEESTIKLYTVHGNPFIKYTEGNIFGDSDTLLELKRDGKAIAITHLKLLVLDKNQFLKFSSEFKEDCFRMIMSAKKKRDIHQRMKIEVDRKVELLNEILEEENEGTISRQQSKQNTSNSQKPTSFMDSLKQKFKNIYTNKQTTSTFSEDKSIVNLQLKKRNSFIFRKPNVPQIKSPNSNQLPIENLSPSIKNQRTFSPLSLKKEHSNLTQNLYYQNQLTFMKLPTFNKVSTPNNSSPKTTRQLQNPNNQNQNDLPKIDINKVNSEEKQVSENNKLQKYKSITPVNMKYNQISINETSYVKSNYETLEGPLQESTFKNRFKRALQNETLQNQICQQNQVGIQFPKRKRRKTIIEKVISRAFGKKETKTIINSILNQIQLSCIIGSPYLKKLTQTRSLYVQPFNSAYVLTPIVSKEQQLKLKRQFTQSITLKQSNMGIAKEPITPHENLTLTRQIINSSQQSNRSNSPRYTKFAQKIIQNMTSPFNEGFNILSPKFQGIELNKSTFSKRKLQESIKRDSSKYSDQNNKLIITFKEGFPSIVVQRKSDVESKQPILFNPLSSQRTNECLNKHTLAVPQLTGKNSAYNEKMLIDDQNNIVMRSSSMDAVMASTQAIQGQTNNSQFNFVSLQSIKRYSKQRTNKIELTKNNSQPATTHHLRSVSEEVSRVFHNHKKQLTFQFTNKTTQQIGTNQYIQSFIQKDSFSQVVDNIQKQQTLNQDAFSRQITDPQYLLQDQKDKDEALEGTQNSNYYRNFLINQIKHKFRETIQQQVKKQQTFIKSQDSRSIQTPIQFLNFATNASQDQSDKTLQEKQMNEQKPNINQEQKKKYFYGNPALLNMVNFNNDMGWIALNVFEIFRLLECSKQGIQAIQETIQNIKAQNDITETRQDKIDSELEIMKSQLMQIKMLKVNQQQA